MPLPIKKKKKSLYLNIANELFPISSINKSLASFSPAAKKTRFLNNKYTEVKFKNLESVLEFSNYLLSLSR